MTGIHVCHPSLSMIVIVPLPPYASSTLHVHDLDIQFIKENEALATNILTISR